jgi:Ca2+/H+ antiporter, TMEM165/GDT1 family
MDYILPFSGQYFSSEKIIFFDKKYIFRGFKKSCIRPLVTIILNKAKIMIGTRGGTYGFQNLLSTFGMIFLAELGDKTQLATFTFAAESSSRWAVFLGSAGTLILTSFLGVAFGSAAHKLVPPHIIKTGTAILFIVLGLLDVDLFRRKIKLRSGGLSCFA